MSHWTTQNIPDQTGHVALVTGANSGLGYETSLALAQKGAHVVMACRNLQKGQAAHDALKKQVPGAALELAELDLGSLDSVCAFVTAFTAQHDRLDLLINNAGVMAPPRRETADGFEQQIGVNHLGHFALTGLLLDLLTATPGSRVVNVSSSAAFAGRMNFDDLHGKQSYARYGAYSQSKLANVLFTAELQRRLAAAGLSVTSYVAHPGLSSTHLQDTTAQASGNLIERGVYKVMHAVFSQSPAQGALPQLYAATDADAVPGAFYGPHFLQIRGYPKKIGYPKRAHHDADARKLWKISEELTGVRYLSAQ